MAKRPNGQWRARYRDSSGREHSRHFPRKADAQRWLDEVTTSVVTGQYVDPNAGRMTFREYAEQWRAAQVHRPSSQAHVETMLRRHAYPTLGDRPLAAILPSEVQAWVKRLSVGGSDRKPLAPSTVGVVHSIASSVFKAAVRDRRIPANPCEGTRLPKRERSQVVPITTEQVEALVAAMPAELRALVTFAAGTGVRGGELRGLTLGRIHFLRREVTIDRQLVGVVDGSPVWGPPKTEASYRTIPLPRVVLDALQAHLEAYDVARDGLLFTMGGLPISRQAFGHQWRAPARSAGIPPGQGLHALRHYYASLLIRHGESVKTVQARLGHASAAETLDTYSHLWPDSDDRTREAVDLVLGAAADSARTGKA
ncbi:tyrosine-type recombinase/integrase [Nocardioides okcheonensis]|uniref:tyrosine-type recombinase/integrase n=1 Tax=Nocardioides okcheonensis TaxID=2894081 RepID=UPI001E3017DA|nr:site-specific integrase [Nocardioides okcheonensis]UFN44523.1 site-specific integrase [Nocardioides okcheonensis]